MRRVVTYGPASLAALVLLACVNDPSAPASTAAMAPSSRLEASSATHGLDAPGVHERSEGGNREPHLHRRRADLRSTRRSTSMFTIWRPTRPTSFPGLLSSGPAPPISTASASVRRGCRRGVGAILFIPFPVTLTTDANGCRFGACRKPEQCLRSTGPSSMSCSGSRMRRPICARGASPSM